MKKYICIITIFSISLTKTYSQGSDGYQIEGTLEGLEKDTLVYLVLNETRDTIAATLSENAKFKFKGKLATAVEWVSVRVANSNKWSSFLLENCNISIDGQLSHWENATVAGSKETDALNQLRRSIRPLQQQIDSAVSVNIEEKKVAGLRDQMLKIKEEFISRYPHLSYTAWLIRNTAEFDVKRKQLEFEKLTTEVQRTGFGSKLLLHIKEARLRDLIKPGEVIPNFQLQTLKGEIVSINDILKQNRVTLIDFWASWCAPCRKFTPELKKIYKEFHRMGFAIVSISSDTDKDAWKKAVAIDKMNWLNAVPVKNFESPQEIFDINAIPSMMLLDSAGRIVAFQCAASSVVSFGFDFDTIPDKKDYLSKKVKEMLGN